MRVCTRGWTTTATSRQAASESNLCAETVSAHGSGCWKANLQSLGFCGILRVRGDEVSSRMNPIKPRSPPKPAVIHFSPRNENVLPVAAGALLFGDDMTILTLCQELGSDAVLDAIQAVANQEALADLLPLCESEPEALFLKAAYPVLPQIIPQFHVNNYRADFAIPDIGLLIEIDGRAYHGNAKSFCTDRQRDRDLVGCGWRVLHFAAREVYEDAEACVAEVLRTPEALPFDDTGVGA